jgi:hypothetical protein
MRSVIEEAKKTADTELLIALKDPLVIVPDLPQDLKLLQRGIKLRYVAEVATLSDPIYGPALREEATKADMFRFVEQVVFQRDQQLGVGCLLGFLNNRAHLTRAHKPYAQDARVFARGRWRGARKVAHVRAGPSQ